ncbi:MAG TPA: hypothetical protein VLB82_00800 [Thermodesulfobacteriota bacterium]|jgi:hypothetical protein|nr:hypothetical protein [Thermodesulfobacteriota bacterium]
MSLQQSYIEKMWLQLCWQGSRLGITGKIGLSLFVVAIVFFFSTVLPQDREVELLKQRVETIKSRSPLQMKGKPGSGGKIRGDQALKVFYDFFPRIDSSPLWIGELVRVAKTHKVEINSSDFHMNFEEGSRLVRYEMVLPVHGSYPQIRAFIADTLKSIPAMAITGINIKRKGVKSSQLEVGLKVNLYLDGR